MLCCDLIEEQCAIQYDMCCDLIEEQCAIQYDMCCDLIEEQCAIQYDDLVIRILYCSFVLNSKSSASQGTEHDILTSPLWYEHVLFRVYCYEGILYC
jgi:hypothetical protein